MPSLGWTKLIRMRQLQHRLHGELHVSRNIVSVSVVDTPLVIAATDVEIIQRLQLIKYLVSIPPAHALCFRTIICITINTYTCLTSRRCLGATAIKQHSDYVQTKSAFTMDHFMKPSRDAGAVTGSSS